MPHPFLVKVCSYMWKSLRMRIKVLFLKCAWFVRSDKTRVWPLNCALGRKFWGKIYHLDGYFCLFLTKTKNSDNLYKKIIFLITQNTFTKLFSPAWHWPAPTYKFCILSSLGGPFISIFLFLHSPWRSWSANSSYPGPPSCASDMGTTSTEQWWNHQLHYPYAGSTYLYWKS